MSRTSKQRLASIITAIIMAYIFYRVLDRLFVVVLVHVQWWQLILLALVLYLVVDHLVRKVFD